MFKAAKRVLQGVGDAHRFFWMSAAFVVLATAAIQYDEVIAPGVSKLTNGFADMTTSLKRLSGTA